MVLCPAVNPQEGKPPSVNYPEPPEYSGTFVWSRELQCCNPTTDEHSQHHADANKLCTITMKKHSQKKSTKKLGSLRNLQFTWLFSHGHSIKNNCGKAKPAAGNGRSQQGHKTGILLTAQKAFQHLHLTQARGWTPKGGPRHHSHPK